MRNWNAKTMLFLPRWYLIGGLTWICPHWRWVLINEAFASLCGRFSMTKRCNKKENRNSNPEKSCNESIFIAYKHWFKDAKKSHLLHSIACCTWLQDVNSSIESLEAYCLSERDWESAATEQKPIKTFRELTGTPLIFKSSSLNSRIF